MEEIQKEAFTVIGITVRTTNENAQGAKDIPALWNRFISEGILDKIPNKIDNTVYCCYTNYEGDYTRPYTTLIGCKVTNTASIPENMTAIDIAASNYSKFIAKGNLLEGAVYNKWLEIWEQNLSRKYSTDFEVYTEKAQNPANAEVAIYIGLL